MASKLIVNEIEHTDGAGTAVTMAKATIADATLTSATLTAGTIGSGVTGTLGSGVIFPAGHIINYKIIDYAPSACVSTSSSSWGECTSNLLITHAMSSASNKLIFALSSIDMYLSSGVIGYLSIGKTTDVTSPITTDNIMLIKHSGGDEICTKSGQVAYLPGVTTEFTYTILHKSTGNAFYLINTTGQGAVRFSLMEVQV